GKLRAQLGDGREFLLPVTGTIEVQPAQKNDFRSIQGEFRGEIRNKTHEPPEIPDGAPVELSLNVLDHLEPAIFPSPDRKIECQSYGSLGSDAQQEVRGGLSGKVLGARGFFDRFEAPLDDVGLQDANGDLGEYFSLGLVYTWIAGLLNLLAIW